jgi:hypothetical protein
MEPTNSFLSDVIYVIGSKVFMYSLSSSNSLETLKYSPHTRGRSATKFHLNPFVSTLASTQPLGKIPTPSVDSTNYIFMFNYLLHRALFHIPREYTSVQLTYP